MGEPAKGLGIEEAGADYFDFPFAGENPAPGELECQCGVEGSASYVDGPVAASCRLAGPEHVRPAKAEFLGNIADDDKHSEKVFDIMGPH